MDAATLPEQAARVAALMEKRLGVPGADLTAKLHRGGRRLPRKVRAAAMRLAELAALAANPRLWRQIDMDEARAAYETCMAHLAPLGRGERAKDLLLSTLAAMAFAVLAVGAGFIAFLVWRGYV